MYMFSSHVIQIDEVSLLTPWVVERGTRIIQLLQDSGEKFSGRKILFVDDILRLPPMVPNSAMPVVQRLIPRLAWWPTGNEYRLERPMRASDPTWNEFMLRVTKGKSDWLGHGENSSK
jgi:hypothetical protein